MLQRLVDDLRIGAGSAVRLTAFAIVIAASLLVTIGFLSAAAFMFVLPREGAAAACLAGGAVFFTIALLAAAAYAIRQQRDKRRQLERAAREAAQPARSTASTLLSDPAVLAIGLQIVRIVGVRRLIPLLAIGGIALGILAGQRDRHDCEPKD